MSRWLGCWRPVFHVQHLSLSPTSPLQAHLPGCAIKDVVVSRDGESLFQKYVNSAFGEVFSAETIHAVSLAALRDEFAALVTTDTVLAHVA